MLISKKALSKVLIAVTASMFALVLMARFAFASNISYDPYADAVQSFSATGITNPANAVGAPDGNYTTTAGVNATVTLDMGFGEEGTGNLRIYFGTILAGATVKVDFLNGHFGVIKSSTTSLITNTSASTRDFPFSYASTHQGYRYVRITSQAEGGTSLDAIRALAYVGSTPTVDTDGDGRADRFEQTHGTDPLVFDKPVSAGTVSSGGNVIGGPISSVTNNNSSTKNILEPIMDRLQFRKGSRVNTVSPSSSWWDRFLLTISSYELCFEGWWFWLFVLGLLALLLLAYLVGYISGENCEAIDPANRSGRQKFLHRMARKARKNKL